MTKHTSGAAPLDSAALQSALGKSLLIFAIVFALMASVALPSVMGEGVDSGTIFSVTIQLVMTTLCVGGWFVLFLAFDRHLGERHDAS